MGFDWSQATGTVKAGGKVLDWARWGAPSDRPVIVLLHEGLGCVALWRGFPAQLAQATGCAVVAYSRAGYGQSDPVDLPRPVNYMTIEATDVLPDILDAIGANRYILCGHSDGATIAAEYAGRVADFRVRGLCLIAPHFFTEPSGLAEIARAAEMFGTTDMATRMGKYHRDPVATFEGWNHAWLNPDFAAWNVADVIDYIRVPALVVQGREDQYGTLAQVEAVENGSYAPVDVAILEDCRHSPHLEQPQHLLDAMAEFTAHLIQIEAAMPEGV